MSEVPKKQVSFACEAANQALKLFKELGHYGGQTAALHCLAKAAGEWAASGASPTATG